MKLIQDIKVVRMGRITPEGNSEPHNDDILYRRNQPNTRLTLVLGGKLGVIAGKDGFRSESGPWSVLGSDALWQEEGTYVPDFTAHVVTEDVRYIQISRTDFLLKVLQRGAGERPEVRERLNRTTSSSAMKRKRRQRRSMLASNLSGKSSPDSMLEASLTDPFCLLIQRLRRTPIATQAKKATPEMYASTRSAVKTPNSSVQVLSFASLHANVYSLRLTVPTFDQATPILNIPRSRCRSTARERTGRAR